MQRERPWTPAEALRLTALGLLACRAPMRYAALANEVRLFAASYGSSPTDAMSSSIELLRFEGLVEIAAPPGDPADPGAVTLALSAAGRGELERLLRAPVKAAGAWARLSMALKMRFLHLLRDDDRALQCELLAEAFEGELARLLALRARLAGEHPHFLSWLDRDIDRARADLAWFQERGASRGSTSLA